MCRTAFPVIIAATCTALFAGTSQAEELSDVIDRVKQSVVQIHKIDRDGQSVSMGSGFAVAPSVIATNMHVLEDGHKFKITRNDVKAIVAAGI